jgi:polysaccharide biosynthesis transport protein
MTYIENSQTTEDAALRAIGPAKPETADLVGIARRGWPWILGGAALGLSCALIVLSNIAPLYKASSRIVFERTLPRYMQTNKVTNEPVTDDYDTLGQTYVISSESVLLPVVKSLSLATDPDFAGTTDSKNVGSLFRGMLQNIGHAMGFSKAPSEDPTVHHGNDPVTVALDTVARDLTVSREDVASVVTIALSAKDPIKAATIVNKIVDTYINQSASEKMQSTNVAGKVVQERVDELKQQVKDAERAVVEYKIANNLAGNAKSTLTGEQLVALQNHLTNARVAMAEAKARMDRIANDPGASALFTTDNALITKLRAEIADLSVRANDIESRVGKDHLAAVKIRTRMEELRGAIASEQKRIAGSFSTDYDLARAQYDEISATLTQAMGEDSANGEVKGRLRELEGAADTLRNLYEKMLQQSSQMSRVESQSLITPDVRVLTRATPPLQTESSKKRLLILAGGSMMGLLLGCAIVLLRDFPFGVFRSSQQVSNATGLDCAILPEVLTADERASLKTGEYVLDWPYSRFAQTLRSIWATINSAQREADAKVICVVSSNPGEGKTTVAINLAAHFALRSTARVLVVDADLHRQSLTNRVAPEARVGFKEALEQPTAIADFVTKIDRLNLDILPCPAPERMPNAAELLGSAEMEKLIEVAREIYDLVIIEAPPIAAVVDYKMIARHCNGFIFVVEWGKTSQRLVLECLSETSGLLDRVLCVVLNKVDTSALRSIEHYKGDGFHAYYSDHKKSA